jgi:hypothetical protein
LSIFLRLSIGVVFSQLRRPDLDADYLHPVQGRNVRRCSYTPSYVFTVKYFVKHRDDFAGDV